MRRPRWIAALAGLYCSVALLPAAPASYGGEPADGAQALIDRMITALGDRSAILALRSLAVEADCTGPGGAFRTRIESLRPGSVYFRQSHGSRTTEIWSTEERTWRRAETGFQNLGEGPRSFVRGHEFHLLLFELESRFSNHRLGDPREVAGKTCHLIVMEDEAGQPASVCLAESDALPLLLELNPAGAEGPIRIRFDSWRKVEGLLYFFAFTLTEGPERTFTYQYQSIAPNSVSADRFE